MRSQKAPGESGWILRLILFIYIGARALAAAQLQTYLACVPAGSAIIDGADTSVCCQPVICS